jgi:hypothetical protein
MKTVVETRDLERSGNFAESNFKIKASAKAFKILSDGLYSDKIKAIIRELSCNAYDAHIEAGNQGQKFDVHLPTSFDPTFYIRDYGTGLSKEDLESIYTTYFESTKTNTNDAIGCLGLGSKSPFSYVDMFTVTSYYDGTQYVYSALLNDHGTPAIMLINESETDEPNGLKVQFAVKKEDTREFSYKASDVYFYFNTIPNLVGHNPDIREREYTVKNDTWGLSSDRRSQAVAIMGNVAYPINLNKVDFSDEERTILQSFPVDLFFKIGDLEVAASREGLSYDEKTTQVIRERVQEIIDHEKARIERDLVKQKTYWDAVVWIKNEKNTNKIVDLLFRHATLEYKGQKIKDYFDLSKKEYLAEVQGEDEEFFISKISYSEKWSRKDYCYRKVLGKPDTTWRINIKEHVKFFINDCKNRHMVRVRHFLEKNKDIDTIYLIKTTNDKLVKRFTNDLDMPKVGLLSEIEPPKVERKKRSDSAVGHFVKMNWVAHEHTETPKFWETIPDDEDFDLDEGGFYIPINRWKTIHNDREEAPRDLLFTLNQLHKIAMPNDPMPKVYGIKKAKLDIVEDRDNWISWIDYVQALVRNYALSPKVNDKLQAICNSRTVNYGQLGRMFRIIQDDKSFRNVNDKKKIIGSQWMSKCECPTVKELAERYDFMNSAISVDQGGTIRSLWNFIQSGRSNLSKDEVENLQKYSIKHDELMRQFRNDYPLLQDCYGSFGNKVGISHILEYINAITQYNS